MRQSRCKRSLSIAAALCLASSAAHADPISVFAAVLPVFGATAAGIAATVVSYISLQAVVLVATIYGSAAARRKQRAAQAQARSSYNANLQERTTTVLRADPPWRTVYGRADTGGEIVAIFTSDKTGTRTDGTSYTKADAYKHLVIVIAAHQCQAINEIKIDGVALGALDANGFVTTGEFASTQVQTQEITIAASGTSTQPSAVTVLNAWDETLSTQPGNDSAGVLVAGSYTLTVGNTVITNTGANPMRIAFTLNNTLASVRVQKHLGTTDQAVSAFLNGLLPAEWTSADRLRGITYVVVTLDLENQRFQGGPPNLTFDISGKLVYDPRSSLTVWSDNAALCTRDYLVGEHGFNCVTADIDDAYAIAAANACDVSIPLTVGGTTTTGATYTCNGVVTTEQGREAVLQDLAECMAGTVTYGAKWLLQAGAWTPPVMILIDDDLFGQIEVLQGGAGMDDTFNTVRGQYVPSGSSVPADFDIYANAAFVAADGRSLYTDIALPFTNHKARCRNLARIQTEKNRDGLVIRYPAKLRAWPLQIGDRVSVTSTEYGFVAKTFLLTDWQFGIGSPVLLVLQEDAAANYDLADAATSDPAANTLLPSPWVVAAPTGVTVTSGTGTVGVGGEAVTSRVRVAWNAITDPYMADGSGRVLVRWRRQLFDAVNVWQDLAPVAASEIRTFIVGVNGADAITVEVRFQNGVGALSPAVIASHTVANNATTVRTTQIATDAAAKVYEIATAGSITITCDSTNNFDTLQTLSGVVTIGKPVEITASVDLNWSVTPTFSIISVGLYRDGTGIASGSATYRTGGTNTYTINITYTDTPAAGTYAYTLKTLRGLTGETASATERRIRTTEIRR